MAETTSTQDLDLDDADEQGEDDLDLTACDRCGEKEPYHALNHLHGSLYCEICYTPR